VPVPKDDRPKRRTRLLLLALSVAAALLAGEALARWSRPRPYAPVVFLTPDGGEVPLAEIFHFLRHAPDPERSGAGPRAYSPALLDVRLKYDRPRWDYFDADGCIRVTHNSLGFRDHEFPVEKPDGELRILTLGDSFTYGTGVRLEDTWPEVLETLIRKGRPGRVEVINGGFAANAPSPAGFPNWLRNEGIRFEPDLVIVGLCLNDMGEKVPMLARAVVPPDAYAGPSELVNRIRRSLASRRLNGAKQDFAEVVRRDPAGWEATQAGLCAMRDILSERGSTLVVAVLPMLSDLGDDYPYLGLHTLAVGFCRGEGIPCVDLLPQVRGLDEHDLWVHETDQHPNDVAQHLFAEGILAFLTRERLLP
jgi:hypothetical protein